MDPKGAGSELQESRGAAPLPRRVTVVLVFAFCTLIPTRPTAGEGLGRAGPVDYTRDIAPLLARWCVSCHGEKESQGGLRLDSIGELIHGVTRGQR